jgi:hypothetical protein
VKNSHWWTRSKLNPKINRNFEIFTGPDQTIARVHELARQILCQTHDEDCGKSSEKPDKRIFQSRNDRVRNGPRSRGSLPVASSFCP